MFDTILKRICNTFIPVVHAGGVEWSPGDDSVLSRLKKATTHNENGKFPKEIANMITYTETGIVSGAFFGTMIFSKNTFMDFMGNSRATQYSSHLDAKDDLNRRMYRNMLVGGFQWTWRCAAITLTYSVLASFIPVIRNRSEWQEFAAAGAISGTLAGHLFSDPKMLGFVRKKYTGRLPFKQFCLLKGFSYGLLIGTLFGAWNCLSHDGDIDSQLRQWEDYWKQTKKSSDVNNSSESK